jgi:MYXO-CTERM domain-containing protein
MRKVIVSLMALGLTAMGWMGSAVAQDDEDPPGECDPHFGECGTPDKSGGGGSAGGSVLVSNTDQGDTYQYSDDRDADGVEDGFDNCPQTPNPSQSDGDGDGVGDSCDNCPAESNADQPDMDGNGVGDKCDDDRDGDGVPNASDNCPATPNPPVGSDDTQPDLDGDGKGDACDADIDGDGVDNGDDACPANADIQQSPASEPDNCFDDKDGDGVPDSKDVCPRVPDDDQADMDGDGRGDKCDPDIDGDGHQNVHDNCPSAENPDQEDSDLDGEGDVCDPEFCYVVYGDQENCLDPKSGLKVYSPSVRGAETGEETRLNVFANRQNQAMRYSWKVIDAPADSGAVVENREGSVSVSTPYQYRYMEEDDAPTFRPDVPGEYELRVKVQTVWEDRQSSEVNATATHTTELKARGEPVAGPGGSGCSQTSGQGPLGAGGWLAALGLGGLFVRRWTDR